MQESYGEGLAIHTGPELCGVSRKAGHEALVGVGAGRIFSPEISQTGVPTLSPCAEGNTRVSKSASWPGTPRGRRPCACTETPRREPGDPRIPPGGPSDAGALERSGKLRDARR